MKKPYYSSLQIKNSTYQVVISYKDENGKSKWVSTGLKEGAGKRRLEEKRKEILSAVEDDYNRNGLDTRLTTLWQIFTVIWDTIPN